MIDELIVSYAAPEPEFTVVLPRGECFKFRTVSAYADLIALKRDAAKFVRMAQSERCPKAWRDYVPENDTETLISAFILGRTSIEPKLSEGDLLKVAAKAALVFNTLVEQWNANQSAISASAEVEEIDELKND